MSLLAAALITYALAMTLGRGQFGALNIVVLLISLAACCAFIAVEARALHPLVRLDLFRDRALVTGLTNNIIVSTVMMATLFAGPFYLGKVIGLGPAAAGLVLAIGPFVAAITGIPAGRLIDRFGAERAALGGLAALAAGAAALSAISAAAGIAGYVTPIVAMTAGYGLFQAANNTKIMTGSSAAERGLVSGVLNLSRNLGLVTGVSAMGAIFAWATAARDVGTAPPGAIVTGMHTTFAVAVILLVGSLLVSLGTAPGNQKRTASPTG